MRKKWFTIFELIIVIWIISILITALNRFSYDNKRDYLYAETCINKVYWDINNFIYSAITSKWIYTGNSVIFPENYFININPQKNEIYLHYKTATSTWTFMRYNLSGSDLKKSYCFNNDYQVFLSWENIEISIKKSTVEDSILPTFIIKDKPEQFTWIIKTLICYTNNCKEIANLLIDTRTESITKRKCVQINNQGTDCLKRDQ